MEEVCRENQIAFHRMMEEAESTAQVQNCVSFFFLCLCCGVKSVFLRCLDTLRLSTLIGYTLLYLCF